MECVCQQCSRPYVYSKNSSHSKTNCNSCLANARRFAIMEKAREYLGGKCKICGYDKCTRALKFHHRNKEEKSFEISGNACRKWEVIKVELDKCDLVCGNCHDEIHAAEDNAHKFIWKPRVYGITEYTKNCTFCSKEFTSTDKKKIMCSRRCSTLNKKKDPSEFISNPLLGTELTTEKLAELLETKSYAEIAREYGLGATTIRMRAIKAGLSSKFKPVDED